MDQIDARILEELSGNGRATASQISKRVHLSIPAVAERIRKLEESGAIECYTVKVNRARVNLRLLAFISVRLDRVEHIEAFRAAVVQLAAVLECHHIAGSYDYLLKVLVEDAAALEDFLSNALRAIPGVSATNTTIVLSTLKERLNRQ